MKRQMRINFWRFISPSMAVYALLPIVTFLQTIWIIQKDVSLWLFAIDGIITAASIATLCSKFKRNRELIVNKQHINGNKSFS